MRDEKRREWEEVRRVIDDETRQEEFFVFLGNF